MTDKVIDNLRELEQLAASALSGPKRRSLLRGEDNPTGWTLENNLAAYADYDLFPRVLVDVSKRSLSTTVLGEHIAIPIMAGPVGTMRRYHPDAEVAVARAVASMSTVMGLSTNASASLEEVAEGATGPKWFQLYMLRDRSLSASLVKRAEAADYKAILFTVDNTTWRVPDSEVAGFRLDPTVMYGNFREPDGTLNLDGDFPPYQGTTFTWADLEWLRSLTTLPIIIKGVQVAEDARLCVEHGVDALVVSNHGGFALEGARGTLHCLPEIVDAVQGRLEIYLDGGIRRGTDVLKALALGARAVLIGRPEVYGLALDGERGVARALEILSNELDMAMGMCGVTDVTAVPRALARRKQR